MIELDKILGLYVNFAQLIISEVLLFIGTKAVILTKKLNNFSEISTFKKDIKSFLLNSCHK